MSLHSTGRKTLLCLLLLITLLSACGENAPDRATPPPGRRTPTLVTAQETPTQAAVKAATQTTTPRPTAMRTRRPTVTPTATPAGVFHPPGPVSVPILLYHRVTDQGSTQYIVPVAEFRAQMKALRDADYQPVTVSQLAAVMREGGRLPEKPVAITFDDGFLDVYHNALPILEEYNLLATAYIITGTIDSELSYGYMQETELKELIRAGWEIGSHSISHYNLEQSRLGIRTELRDSKKLLEDLLGIEVLSFSYPFAVTNNWIKERVEEYGYTSAVGVGLQVTHTPEHLYFLSRREVYRGTSLKAFRELLGESEQTTTK